MNDEEETRGIIYLSTHGNTQAIRMVDGPTREKFMLYRSFSISGGERRCLVGWQLTAGIWPGARQPTHFMQTYILHAYHHKLLYWLANAACSTTEGTDFPLSVVGNRSR